MTVLASYLVDAWTPGTGREHTLRNPATTEALATVRDAGELASAVAHARTVGGPSLRALTYRARAEILAELARVLADHRDALLDHAMISGGNTRGDAKFDVDGASAVLATYAEIGRELGEQPWIPLGEASTLLRTSKLRAQHVLTARHGMAIHINAFNFPAWGMLGKFAVAFLAGMPTLSKPATSTSSLAHCMAERMVESELLPRGSFQLLMGGAGDLLTHVQPHDVVAFTGSANTGALIRAQPDVMAHNVRVNIEADSLNAAVLAPDVEPGSELFDAFIRDCVVEITQKAGQKCTATRRILVPRALMGAVRETLSERLQEMATRTGNPLSQGVRMGPLATKAQLEDARAGLIALAKDADIIVGDPSSASFVGVPDGTGYFLAPTLLLAHDTALTNASSPLHNREVFGPVSTLFAYDGTPQQAARVVALGQGSLVVTLYTDDRTFAHTWTAATAPWVGRVVLVDARSATYSMPPGCVFPVVGHGGPGRAGEGAELGGTWGLHLYSQRTTLQGGGSQLARLVGSRSGE